MKEPGYRDEHAALLARQAALEDEIARLKAEKNGGAAPATTPPAKQPALALVSILVVMCIAFVWMLSRPQRTKRPDPAPPHSVQASWEGKVASATGAAGVSPGAPCLINARLDYRGQAFLAVHQTVVTCGGVELYSERAVFAAGNSREVTYNASSSDGRYDFLLDEIGVATRPHPHASIDTARGIGLIAGEVPRMSVEIAIVPGSKDARDAASSR